MSLSFLKNRKSNYSRASAVSTGPMQKIIENYVLYEVVGSGQYGKVHRAINKKTNETVAIKVIPLSKFVEVPKLEEFTTNEIKILGRIDNPNVIKFIEMLKTANNMYLVYEFCEGGTLENILSVREHLPEPEGLKIFQHLLNACRALYKEFILHRDIKPSNILIHKGVIKVADFGFCKRLHSANELTLSMVGSPIYMAPEILKGFPYSTKADIWSLGVLLFELLFGSCPYEDKTLAGLISQFDIKQLTFPRDVNPISKSTETLLRRLLTIDPKQRIEWDDIMKYPLFPQENTEVRSSMRNQQQPSQDETQFSKIPLLNQPSMEAEPSPSTTDAFYGILHSLVVERNKVVYLITVLHAVLQENLTIKAPIVAFMMAKKARSILELMARDLAPDNSNSRLKALPQWEFFKNAEEHKIFTRYIAEEIEEVGQILTFYKEEMNKLLSNTSILDEASERYLKGEVMSLDIEERYFNKMTVTYAEEVKSQVFISLMKKQDDTAAVAILQHVNEVLDASDIEKFSNSHMRANMRWEDNEYFQNLKKWNKDKLTEAITKKINTIKSRPI